jgi:Fe-S cluster biosynthesis and repair protein YggX
MEVSDFKSIKGQQDWIVSARKEYYKASQSGSNFNGTSNSFFTAALYNTEKYLPGEYTTIWLRHVYYDLVSLLLMYPRDITWNKVKEIRFFDAANIVTGIWGLSAVKGFAARLTLSPDTVKLITGINRMLFEENMVVIKNLFFDIRFPFVIPRGCFFTVKASIEISALKFDLQMVEFEQTHVATYINLHQTLFTTSVVSEMNSLMKDDWKQFFVPATFLTDYGIPWAKKVLNVSDLNFMEYKHREAIGKAMVYFFHKMKYSDYETYMKTI